jgi:hypothetical protein
MPTFYSVDDRKFSPLEFWRVSPNLIVFLACLVKTKLFRSPVTRGVTAVRFDEIGRVRLDAFLLHLNHLFIDAHLRRGVLVPLEDR